MRRCPLPPEALRAARAPLPPEAAHYLTAVLRLKEGAEFIGFDGQGGERVLALARDAEGELRAAEARGDLTRGRAGAPLTLCYGVPKGDKLDLVARMLTELGVGALDLWAAERSVSVWREGKQDSKLERLERVADEAARQCGRADALRLSPPAPLRALLTRHAAAPARLYLDPAAAGGLPERLEGPCALCVGPEGGLAPSELEALREAGWRGVALATPVLRTETAAVVACALALDRLGWA
ncbi:MAG: 16S rRNA (uracil(1498)-N(3))-methyltransferase [Deltaproteobacteria bacterium]|nr:16S rRNA (uracil(1498)-N(3))-methyltransferase [Deltaproteobacteria bacterium]